jgi:hypothetical protein
MSASRREFAKRLAIAAVAAPLLESSPVLAQAPPTPPAPPPGSRNIRLAEAQTDILRARYGDHITPDDARTIEEDLDRLGGYMERLREFELHNWDEPDTIFFALGRDE